MRIQVQQDISKVTLGGEEIQGALLQVIDEEGNTVDQWYSDGNEHPVSGLEEGKTYTLHEDLAPLGFNLVNDISFTVSYEKENQKRKETRKTAGENIPGN